MASPEALLISRSSLKRRQDPSFKSTNSMAANAHLNASSSWMPEQRQHVGEELRCGYSSKRCDGVRTTKKGGGLHTMCEFHRQRANKNQQRVDNKRRAVRAQRRRLQRSRAVSKSDELRDELRGDETLLSPEDIDSILSMVAQSSEEGSQNIEHMLSLYTEFEWALDHDAL